MKNNDYDLKYWDYKSIRDPLYGFIHLSKRETGLIDTPYMHRLTRIKQLAHTYLVYPSAVHTRFEHSLGISHIASRMCASFNICGKRKETVRAAALLHDIGHGPFSHLFEDIMSRINGDFSHEMVTSAIIKYDEQISSILKGNISNIGSHTEKLDDIYSEVLSIFDKNKEDKNKEDKNKEGDQIAKFIISSRLDADKMDYLRRDSYHTGSTYGTFDLEEVLSTLTLASEVAGVFFPVTLEKGIPALESFRLARYSLHTQVYQHHARLIADQMFLRSLELAIFDEKVIPSKTFQFKGREKKFIEEFLSMDDSSIYNLILEKSKKRSDSSAYQIISDLKDRRLFKRCYETDVNKIQVGILMALEKNRDNLQKHEKEIASAAKIPNEFVIVHLESEEPGLEELQIL